MKSKSIEVAGVTGNLKPRHDHWPFSHQHNPSRVLTILIRLLALALALLCIGAMRTRACGPDFPNYILDEGERDLLIAPRVDFERELARLQLRPSRFRTVQTTNDTFIQDSIEAELSDLRSALKRAKTEREEARTILEAHAETRAKLKQFLHDHERYAASRPTIWDAAGGRPGEPTIPAPKFPVLIRAPGLPVEFADYVDGASAWHNPSLTNKAAAREPWGRLLARPEAARKYKSTWAAFMLGRSWAAEDPDKALDYFKQVRELAKRGFADSLGLAAASIGLEAKVHYDRKDYARALELYLEQYSSGDGSAANSLLFAAASALAAPDAAQLRTLAANENSRRVITAYLISHHGAYYVDQDGLVANCSAWLAAVEATGVQDVASAEQLALAAYQAGNFDAAQRWIERSRNSPTAQWLQAKLLMRAGKLDEAAALLAKVIHAFPFDEPGTNAPIRLEENLFVQGRSDYYADTPAGCELLAEIGALKLARREFTQALDALLNAGFWLDAAYVAERVLTTEELKSYVDRSWPLMPAEQPERETTEGMEALLDEMRESIRYLLGRRLTREKRGHEAREYFPAEWQPPFDQLISALIAGQDETQSAEQRGRAMFTAAIIARTNGLELVGTEVEPDWHVHAGDYQDGVTIQARTNESCGIGRASDEEAVRAFQHAPDPNERFHYRYQAAYLGWAAAKLLPDNSDETAMVLCRSGAWLKNMDPATADLFYKALVRRCRKTALGAEADRIRWFPRLDENANWFPREPKPDAAEAQPATPLETPLSLQVDDGQQDVPDQAGENEVPPIHNSGDIYTIRQGDILLSVARANPPSSLRQIVQANPGINAARLYVWQRIINPQAVSADEE